MPRQSAASLGFPSVTGLPPRLSPPADLGVEERQVFLDLIAASRADSFRPSDSPLLSAYCRAIALERRSAQELAAGDAQALGRWNGAVKAMLGLAMRLRLSPQARAPNNPSRPGAKPERALSYYEQQALREGDDGGA
jgi:hypothetical protein